MSAERDDPSGFTHWIESTVGSRAGLEVVEKAKVACKHSRLPARSLANILSCLGQAHTALMGLATLCRALTEDNHGPVPRHRSATGLSCDPG